MSVGRQLLLHHESSVALEVYWFYVLSVQYLVTSLETCAPDFFAAGIPKTLSLNKKQVVQIKFVECKKQQRSEISRNQNIYDLKPLAVEPALDHLSFQSRFCTNFPASTAASNPSASASLIKKDLVSSEESVCKATSSALWNPQKCGLRPSQCSSKVIPYKSSYSNCIFAKVLTDGFWSASVRLNSCLVLSSRLDWDMRSFYASFRCLPDSPAARGGIPVVDNTYICRACGAWWMEGQKAAQTLWPSHAFSWIASLQPSFWLANG